MRICKSQKYVLAKRLLVYDLPGLDVWPPALPNCRLSGPLTSTEKAALTGNYSRLSGTIFSTKKRVRLRLIISLHKAVTCLQRLYHFLC
jgi:hypothetical protein